MPTIRVHGRALDARPDRVDLRDYPYRPPLISLPEEWPPPDWVRDHLPDYAKDEMVLDQGNEGACTGFGLAAVVNFLKWERWRRAGGAKGPVSRPQHVSPRMLYQNARLYDEWKGEDYEGSSCRGAMKGFHKHGVCLAEHWPYYAAGKKPGIPKEGWEESAGKTPLGAYYRIQTDWIVAMQAAINEVHAIYVAASAHDGWELKKRPSIEKAVIGRPKKPERGGHAFALVGYRPDGFIVQNSWGPGWGYQGFAILPYEDWLENGYDAWVLALGAPLANVAKKATSTRTSLVARAGQGALPPAAAAAAHPGSPQPWGESEVARHALIVGAGGRPVRHLVEASDEADGVRRVVAAAKASGLAHVAIYAHGGLNDKDKGLTRARIMGPWFEANGIHPIFIVWQTGFLESVKNVIEGIGRELLGLAAPARGGLLEIWRERRDRTFEALAREAGVKAIWEDMKSRAELASVKEGATALAAKSIAASLDGLNLHLIGHSAGAILLGHFLRSLKVDVATCHLWAPACTVDFASKTFGAAIADGTLRAKQTFIEALSDDNERGHYTVPLLYSKSLLYLVSRALEPEHKTPILGMEMAMPAQQAAAAAQNIFHDNAKALIKRWSEVGKGAFYQQPISAPAVPTRFIAGQIETTDADHGSFDNSLDSFNRALSRMLGKKPPQPAVDLTGF